MIICLQVFIWVHFDCKYGAVMLHHKYSYNIFVAYAYVYSCLDSYAQRINEDFTCPPFTLSALFPGDRVSYRTRILLGFFPGPSVPIIHVPHLSLQFCCYSFTEPASALYWYWEWNSVCLFLYKHLDSLDHFLSHFLFF